MKQIPLTRGLAALVDDEDYSRAVAAGSWCASLCGNSLYAQHSVGRKTVRLHTFLTGWPYVDHVNGDGLDNRRANLRPASQSQNNANAKRQKRSATGYKGVHFYRRTGRYRAHIGMNGISRHLGYFDTPEDAARAYDEAAISQWGEFARLNFPEEQAS